MDSSDYSRFVPFLTRLDLFRDIENEELNSFLELANPRLKKSSAGTVVLSQGDRYEALHILVDGVCTGEMINEGGKEMTVEEMTAPFIIAAGIFFADEPVLPVSVRARNDVTFLVFLKGDLFRFCHENGVFLKHLLGDLSNKVRFLTERLSSVTFGTIRRKLAAYLLKNYGAEFAPVNVEKLARFFGVERPSLSREIMKLRDEGIIGQSGRQLAVFKPEKLSDIAKGSDI